MIGKSDEKVRLQSAMEYLMTYGWAILIIAVVLGALYSLGIFSSATFAPQGCIVQPGFECQNPILTTSTGLLTLTFGQSAGSTWSSANIIFVPYGYVYSGNYGTTGAAGTWPSNSLGQFASGQTATVSLKLTGLVQGSCPGSTMVSGGASALSTVCQGTLWANVVINGITAIQEIGTITIKSS